MSTTRRKATTAAALLTALAVSLTGCGDDEPGTAGPGSKATPGTASTASADPATSPGTAPTGAPTSQPTASYKPFTGPGVEAFGQDAVREAYVWATAAMLETTFDDGLLRLDSDKARQIDFTNVEKFLTPRAKGIFREATAALEAKGSKLDQDTRATIIALATWDLESDGLVLRPRSYRKAAFGGATNVNAETVEGRERLVLDFPVSGEILLTDTTGHFGPKDGDVYATFDKKVSLSLVENDDPKAPWLIDGWYADYQTGKVLPDTGKS